MKIKHFTLTLLLFIPLLLSCSREVEIVEFDDTFEIDEGYVFVDIPEKMDYNPNNIIYYSGATEAVLTYTLDEDNSVIMKEKKIPVVIKLKKPLTEAVNVVFTEDESLLDNYTGEQLDYKSFPEGTFANAVINIPKGVTTVEGWIELKNTDKFNAVPGYLTGLKMVLQKETDNTVISRINHSLFIKVNQSKFKDEENVKFALDRPSGYLDMDKNKITPISNYAKDHLYKLLDGSYWTNWWIPSGSNDNLTLSFPKAKVGGIHLQLGNYWDPGKTLKSVKVAISEDGSSYFKQGEISTPRRSLPDVYIIFENPHEITDLRLYDFIGDADIIDINQISILMVE